MFFSGEIVATIIFLSVLTGVIVGLLENYNFKKNTISSSIKNIILFSGIIFVITWFDLIIGLVLFVGSEDYSIVTQAILEIIWNGVLLGSLLLGRSLLISFFLEKAETKPTGGLRMSVKVVVFCLYISLIFSISFGLY